MESTFFFYGLKCIYPLTHGPLAKNLSCYYEGCPNLFHIFFCQLMHVYAAVHTGVYTLSIAVLWIPYNLYIVQTLLKDFYGNAKFIRNPCSLIAANTASATACAKCRGEIQGNYINALLQYHLDCQRRIKASGKKGNSFSIHSKYLHFLCQDYIGCFMQKSTRHRNAVMYSSLCKFIEA